MKCVAEHCNRLVCNRTTKLTTSGSKPQQNCLDADQLTEQTTHMVSAAVAAGVAAAVARLQAGCGCQPGEQAKGALWDPVGTGVDLVGLGVNLEVETDPQLVDKCLEAKPDKEDQRFSNTFQTGLNASPHSNILIRCKKPTMHIPGILTVLK